MQTYELFQFEFVTLEDLCIRDLLLELIRTNRS